MMNQNNYRLIWTRKEQLNQYFASGAKVKKYILLENCKSHQS